jgi:hypothetical protein
MQPCRPRLGVRADLRAGGTERVGGLIGVAALDPPAQSHGRLRAVGSPRSTKRSPGLSRATSMAYDTSGRIASEVTGEYPLPTATTCVDRPR